MTHFKQNRLIIAALFLSLMISIPSFAFAQEDAAAGALVTIFLSIFSIIWGAWFFFILAFVVLNFCGIIFWVFMVVDVVKRDFKNENDKTVWLLVVLLTSWIGALIYYFNVKTKDTKNGVQNTQEKTR